MQMPVCRYVGAWRFDLPSGHGCHNSPGGALHEGEFLEGLKDGWGLIRTAEGHTFCGELCC